MAVTARNCKVGDEFQRRSELNLKTQFTTRLGGVVGLVVGGQGGEDVACLHITTRSPLATETAVGVYGECTRRGVTQRGHRGRYVNTGLHAVETIHNEAHFEPIGNLCGDVCAEAVSVIAGP